MENTASTTTTLENQTTENQVTECVSALSNEYEELCMKKMKHSLYPFDGKKCRWPVKVGARVRRCKRGSKENTHLCNSHKNVLVNSQNVQEKQQESVQTNNVSTSVEVNA